MIPKETRELFAVPKRHPIAFTLLYLPVVASVAIASFVYRTTLSYNTVPLLWCFFVNLFLIRGLYSGELTDNSGASSRKRTPIRFWGKVVFWSAAYMLAMALPIMLQG